jgi:hypothetical protein
MKTIADRWGNRLQRIEIQRAGRITAVEVMLAGSLLGLGCFGLSSRRG